MKSLISKHTRWYSFVRYYAYYITGVTLVKQEQEGKNSNCLVMFRHNEDLIGTTEFADCSIAYRQFVRRYGIDFVECVGFTPARIAGCRYSKAVQQKWGWN